MTTKYKVGDYVYSYIRSFLNSAKFEGIIEEVKEAYGTIKYAIKIEKASEEWLKERGDKVIEVKQHNVYATQQERNSNLWLEEDLVRGCRYM